MVIARACAYARETGWGNFVFTLTQLKYPYVCSSVCSLAMSLSVNDLKVLFPELYPARTKWYDIGLMLGVPVDTLESIQSETDDVGACLRKMLLCALKSVNPKLTWKHIIDALKSVVVSEERLADKLSGKYCIEGI